MEKKASREVVGDSSSDAFVALLFALSLVLFDGLGPVLLVDLHLIDCKVHARQERSERLEVGTHNKLNETDLTATNVCSLAVAKHRNL